MAKGESRRENGAGSWHWDGKRWVFRVSVPGTGGQRRKTFSAKTKAAARKKFREWLDVGSPVDPDKASVPDYLDRWLRVHARHSVAPSTLVRYESDVRLHLKPAFAGLKLAKLVPFHVEELKASLLDKGLAPNTATRVLAVLSAALNAAEKNGLIPSNPARNVRRPKPPPKKMRALSQGQVAALLGVVRGTRHEALYFLACRLGLREGELCGLKWEDVDLVAAMLRVWRSVNAHTGGIVWGATKTGGGRTIALDASEVAALKRHKKIQAAERVAAKEWRDEGLVFPGTRGGVKWRTPLLEEFRRHLRLAGVPAKTTFHDLRHTAATLMVQNGEPIRTVSDILGHANPAMTLVRYSHVLPVHQEAAARRRGGYAF